MFLELLGNSLIRSPTAAYLQEKSDLFVRYATDPDFQQRHLGAVDMSALKVGPHHGHRPSRAAGLTPAVLWPRSSG